jgi:HlyD family secretion protein
MSKVDSGIFSEYIHITGTIQTLEPDTTQVKVIADIDELYWSLVDKGLKATASVDGREYELVVTAKDTLMGGRFKIGLAFVCERPARFSKRVRMSLTLSSPRVAILLPVGGWYRDTGGKWIYLVLNKDRVVKQAIVLGCKNPEDFEVLSGLKPGDVVITSTYYGLPLTETLTLAKMVEAFDD